MSGFRRRSVASVFGVLLFVIGGLLGIGCQTSESADPERTAEPDPTTTSTTSRAATTRPSTTPATLSELRQAEIDIEAVIQAWWTYPIDSSLGEEGLPLQYLTGLLYDRLIAAVDSFEAEGQVYLLRTPSRLRFEESQIDLDAGLATVEICGFSDEVVLDAASREVVLENADDNAYPATVTVRVVDGEWKVNDFFGTSENADAEPCTLPE